jgi:hypothetical protein
MGVLSNEGMWNHLGDDKSKADGTKGHRHANNLASVFPDNPIWGPYDGPAPLFSAHSDILSLSKFYDTTNSVQNQNFDYLTVNGQNGIDMNYHGNIPSVSETLVDMEGLTPPYRVPNPSGGGDAKGAGAHDPTQKKAAPDNYQETLAAQNTTFGSGVGSEVDFEDSTKKLGNANQLALLHLGKSPGTPIGG